MNLILFAFLFCYFIPTNGVQITASYRKDHYLPDLKEDIDYNTPTDGGRVHVAIIGSNCTKGVDLTSVLVNDQECINLPWGDSPDFTYFDWARVHHDNQTGLVWLSFHSRNKKWLPSGSASLTIKVKQGSKMCFSGVAKVDAKKNVQVTYVTTRNQGQHLIVHTHNFGTKGIDLTSYIVLGKVHQGTWHIGAGQSHVMTFDMTNKLLPGSLWSVAVVSKQEGTSGWGGRVIPERFPIEAWPHSSDCPIPGANDDNANELLAAGIDSVFLDNKKCGDIPSLVSALGDKKSPMHVMVNPNVLSDIKNMANIDAINIGDEVDGKMDKNLRDPSPRNANKEWPSLPTFQGAKTNSHVGSYSGITDIQGMDAYCAACAPTMLPVIKTLPLQYPYFYLKTARDNHMPLPTWLYSQLYSEAWSYQANENEIITEIGQVLLAGGKGMMLFQSEHKLFSENDFASIAKVLLSVKSLREDFRLGDIGGLTFTTSAKLNKEVMIEVIRSPDRVVVVVVSTNAKGYNNVLCHTFVDKHWSFDDLTVKSIDLNLPQADSTPNVPPVHLSKFGEMVKGKLITPTDVKVSYADTKVSLTNIEIPAKHTTRFFVFDVNSA